MCKTVNLISLVDKPIEGIGQYLLCSISHVVVPKMKKTNEKNRRQMKKTGRPYVIQNILNILNILNIENQPLVWQGLPDDEHRL